MLFIQFYSEKDRETKTLGFHIGLVLCNGCQDDETNVLVFFHEGSSSGNSRFARNNYNHSLDNCSILMVWKGFFDFDDKTKTMPTISMLEQR